MSAKRPPALVLGRCQNVPLTGTGTSLLVVVPFPSSPERLSPQQSTAPLDIAAQLWDAPGPAPIELTLVSP